MLYHGSTFKFDFFNTPTYNNNFCGKGIYLSTCWDDSFNNYALIGPDTKNKVMCHAYDESRNSELKRENVNSFANKIVNKYVGDNAYVYECDIKGDIFAFEEYYHGESIEEGSLEENIFLELKSTLECYDTEFDFDNLLMYFYGEITGNDLINSMRCMADDSYHSTSVLSLFCEILYYWFSGVRIDNVHKYFNMDFIEGVSHYTIFNSKDVEIISCSNEYVLDEEKEALLEDVLGILDVV